MMNIFKSIQKFAEGTGLDDDAVILKEKKKVLLETESEEYDQSEYVHKPFPVSLYNLNTFLLPEIVEKMKKESRCIMQAERAQRIGEFAKTVDIVALQEMWGTHVSVVEKAISATHHIPKQNQSTGSSNTVVNQLLDTSWQYLNSNGGLYFGVVKEIDLRPHGYGTTKPSRLHVIFSMHETFDVSASLSKKGACATLIDMRNVWGMVEYQPARLLVVNTHLDTSKHPTEQMKQITELYDFILRQLEIVAELSPQDIADAESFPTSITNTKNRVQRVFQSVAVVICGDFNCTSDSVTYSHLMKLFTTEEGIHRLRDLYRDFKKLPADPPIDSSLEEATFSSNNSLAYAKYGEGAKIDHIFALDSLESKTLGRLPLLKLDVDSFDIVRQPRGEEFSDHYGLLMKIHPRISA